MQGVYHRGFNFFLNRFELKPTVKSSSVSKHLCNEIQYHESGPPLVCVCLGVNKRTVEDTI